MFRKNIYKWHRIISLIIAIPVILWSASGFMHPIMTTIRPSVATQILKPITIDSSRIKISLNDALAKNNIQHLHNFRLVSIDTNLFYQVAIKAKQTPLYLSTKNGKLLRNGDQLYAMYLASQFLEGQYDLDPKQTDTKPDSTETTSHDCCDAATICVMSKTKGNKISSVEKVKEFGNEYKLINRLLPVYKVKFDRPDGIRIYVETTSDRFVFAVDNKRAVFDKIFSLFHNWEFLKFAGKFKHVFMALLLGIAFVNTCIGLYIFYITKTKKSSENSLIKARNNHRWSAVIISLFTLMFTFSGAFHALQKLKYDDSVQLFTNNHIASSDFLFDYNRIAAVVKAPIINVSLVKMDNQLFWQVVTKKQNKKSNKSVQGNDLMKSMKATPPSAVYLNGTNYTALPEGEIRYAKYLASTFSKNSTNEIASVELITKFTDEYGFVNKRLPVWKVNYKTNYNERYYVETSSGELAVRIDDTELIEGLSFAFLHKHHFMDWGGKELRDFSTMFWAMAQIVLITFGFILFIKSRRLKQRA